jgi:hypothetical protein
MNDRKLNPWAFQTGHIGQRIARDVDQSVGPECVVLDQANAAFGDSDVGEPLVRRGRARPQDSFSENGLAFEQRR